MSSPKVKPQNHNNNILPIIACKEIVNEKSEEKKRRHKRKKIMRLYAKQYFTECIIL
jgi:predicted transcriptional regulator